MLTIEKRETSFEGLSEQFEAGSDGIHYLITEDKNTIFRPKISITKKDLEEIPYLRQLREAINAWEASSKTKSGKEAYMMRKALIEMRKDQYLIKKEWQKPISLKKLTLSKPIIKFDETIIVEEGNLRSAGVTLVNPATISHILCHYSRLKEESYDKFDGDTWYFMQSFDEIADKALKNYPLYERIVQMKVDGEPNDRIKEALFAEFKVDYSSEHISSLWRHKIPKLIAN